MTIKFKQQNVIHIDGYGVIENEKDNYFEEVSLTKDDLVVLKITIDSIPDNYKICNITLPIQYQFGIKGFDLTIYQTSFNYDDDVSTLYDSLLDAVILDKVKINETEYSSEEKEVLVDLTKVKFTRVNDSLVATIIISNTYENYQEDTDKEFYIFTPVAYKLDQSPSIIIELVNLSNADNKISTINENLTMNLYTKELFYTNYVYIYY